MRKPNKVFGGDGSSSDDNLEEDEEDGAKALDWRSRAVAKAAEKSMQRNQARQVALKALAEDPTVFQYDEVYDEMQQKKEEKKPPKEERKPKYIGNLLKTAELRKVELERRVERKVQKERETEGDTFNDKESFVTPAYRAKLAELKKLEEEERLRELREASLDVTKQQDLSGFYRHLYKQTFSEDQPKKVEEPEEPVTFKKEAVESEVKSRRQYRSRREEEEEVDEEKEEEEPSPEQGTEQPEVPGDQNISNAEGGKSRSKEDRRPAASASLVSAAAADRGLTADRAAKKTAASDDVEKPRADIKEEDSESDDDDDEKGSIHSPPPEEVAPPPKIKIDIWKKRTTGHLLEEAIQRYLARKEAREMN
nr:EOG090X0D2W [Daphnia pulex]